MPSDQMGEQTVTTVWNGAIRTVTVKALLLTMSDVTSRVKTVEMTSGINLMMFFI